MIGIIDKLFICRPDHLLPALLQPRIEQRRLAGLGIAQLGQLVGELVQDDVRAVQPLPAPACVPPTTGSLAHRGMPAP